MFVEVVGKARDLEQYGTRAQWTGAIYQNSHGGLIRQHNGGSHLT